MGSQKLLVMAIAVCWAFGFARAQVAPSEHDASAARGLVAPIDNFDADFEAIWQVLLRGDYVQGLESLEQLYRRTSERLGLAAPMTLKVQYYLASTLHRLGRLPEAKAAFESIIDQHRQAGTMESRSAIATLGAYARVTEALDSPRSALPMYRQALAKRSEVLGDDDLESVTLLDDYAGALVALGHIHEALPLIDQALSMRRKGLGEKHRWTLTTLNNRAAALYQAGRTKDALLDNETVLRHRLDVLGEQDPTTLTAMGNTANVLAKLGRLEEALALHKRAVGLQTSRFGSKHFSTLTNRRGVARDLLALGRQQESLDQFREIFEESRRAWGAGHHHTLSAQVGLVSALEALSRFPEALAEVDDSYARHVEALGNDHFSTLEVAVQRSRIKRLMGVAPQAQHELMDVVARAQALYGAALPLAQQARAELAANHLAAGETHKAGAILAGLLADTDSEIGAADPDNAAPPITLQANADWARMQARAYALLGRPEHAFEVIERQKSSWMLGLLGERQSAIAAGVGGEDLSRLQNLRERVLALRESVRTAKGTVDRHASMYELDATAAAIEEHKASLRNRYPLFRRLTELPAATVSDARLLPKDAMFISYVVEQDRRVSALTLDPTGKVQWHQLGERVGLAQAIASLRLWATQLGQRRLVGEDGRPVDIVHWTEDGIPRWRVVTSASPPCQRSSDAPNCRPAAARIAHGEADFNALRESLGALLLAPMQLRLNPYRRWVVSPDAALGATPFDILPWRGTYLARTIELSQLQSLSVLRAMKTANHNAAPGSRGHQWDLLAIGDPVYGPHQGTSESARQAGGGMWQRLPAAQTEIEGAALSFARHRTRTIMGADATETRLRALSATGELAKARYILFSTHAWYSPARPASSHFVLGKLGDAADNDGRMGAGELSGLQMNSDLTVIAACSTALSEIPSIDGQFGFAFGLNVAGNRNAVLTLWPVADQATAHFVTRLFTLVAKGVQPTRALATTKREFMRHPHLPWRHPKAWAAFAMFGV